MRVVPWVCIQVAYRAVSERSYIVAALRMHTRPARACHMIYGS